MSSRSRKIQRQSVASSASPSPSSSGQTSPAANSNLPLPNHHEFTSSSLSNNLIKSTINPTSMNQISQTSIHLSSPPGGSAQAQLNYTKHHNPPSSTSTSGTNSNPISRNPSGPNSTATTPGGMPSHFNMIHSATTSQSHSGASTPSTSGIASSNATSVTGGRRPVVLETNHLQLKTHEASGRRMINQYIIEDELGRGVHGKVRLARDTDTGEKVAVKIVEREGRKRLGGGAVGNWGRGATLGRERERERRSEKEGRQLENQSSIPSNSTDLKGKGKESATDSDHHREESEKPFQGQINNENPPASPKSPATRFAPAPSTPTKSPGSSSLSGRASTQAAAALAGRYGRWGGGTPSRPTYADKELEKAEKAKEKERTKRSMLWTTDKKVKREIAIMKKCCHENVVMLKEVIDDPQSKKIFMVLEYMEGGEVQWKDIRGFPTMTISEARQTVRDVVCGLEYLHYQGIIHRDIKPANLLWDSSRRVKISDFGVSHFSYSLLVAGGGLPTHSSSGSSGVATKDPSLVDDHELAKTAGSPAFFAPELCLSGESIAAPPSTVSSTRNTPAALSESPRSKEFPFPAAPLTKISKSEAALPNRRTIPGPAPRDRKLPITKAIDIWALGVTLYCLLFGHPPFTAESEYALFSVISNEDYTLPTWMGADRVKVGPRAPRWKELKQWTDEEGDVAEEEPHDPDAREEDLPEEARLLRDLLDRLLDKDPATRIKLEEVKTHPWVTRDLEAPDAWLDETDIQKHPFVEISHEDVEGALTGFSKMKRTFKNLRHKIIESFVGHHHHHREGLGPDGLVLGRKRSKSASHLQPFDLTPMSSNLSGSTAHQIIHSSPRSAGVNVMHHSVPLTPVAVGGTVKAPKTPSHRPGFFFRRQSSVIPSEKSLKAGARNLTYVASSEGTPGRRVNGQGSISAKESRSQPATRSSSPILTETEGSVSAEAKLRKISAQASSQQSPPPSGNFPWIVSSLLPSDAANAAAAQRSTKPSIYQRRSSARSDLLVSKEPSPTPIETASPALNRSSSDSPTSSRLIARESLASANHPLERVDTSGRRSQDTDTGRWSTASGSIAQHQSSRSRLGDLFRGVWSNGSSSPRSSRKSRSRPGTAASRGAPPSSFREPIGKASMDSLSQHGSSAFHRASNQEVFASKSVSSSPFAHAPPPLTVDAIGASTSVGPRPARDSPSSAPLPWNDRLRFSSAQGQGRSDSSSRSVSPQDAFSARHDQALNEPQRIDLETDDVDLDLEFSDDDLDENVRGGRIRGIKNDGSGWRSDTGRGSRGGLGPRNPNGFDSGGVSTDDERHGGSPYRSGPESSEGLTPSVEGGYNLFKPPYTGIVHHSSSGDERDSVHSHPQVTAAPYSSSSIPPNNAYAIGDDSEAAALRRGMGASETVDPNSPSLQPSPSNWNDRFADADETAVLPQPRPISASGSQSQTTAALNTEVDSGFVNATLKHDQRGEVRDEVKDYGDGQDGYESEGDGGVSFEIRKKSA